MRVSVIVPTFNTGPSIRPLIDSLRAQTLPASEWEAVFVDDGSSDDTPALVEGLIATAPNMRLIREAPSGWPGRPRNVGVEAARGEYVFFSDDDDTLEPEALQRLTDFALLNGSDVVVPRLMGVNRGVPAISRTVVDAQDEPALIMSSLAPQKLFRRRFLLESGIRFVEGRHRLEDHLFVVTAYLRARRVSTYADYPCYRLTYQTGRAHISQQQPDWRSYFASVRACLDVVDAEARTPEVARVMRSRWLRAEALSRLRGDGYAKLGTPELVHEVRRLLEDRYAPSELTHLRPIDRMLAQLLLAGRDDDVAALAAWESSLHVATTVHSAEIDTAGRVRVVLSSHLRADRPVLTAGHDDGRYPDPDELLDQVSSYVRIGVELQHADTKARRPLRVEHGSDGVTVAVLPGDGEPLAPGRWTVMGIAGEHRNRRRRAVDAMGAQLPVGRRRIGRTTVELVGSERLVLQVLGRGRPAAVAAAARWVRRVRRVGARGFRPVGVILHQG